MTSQIQNLPEGLDPEIVKQTARGKKWGEQDQKRYDVATGKRIKGSQVRDMRQDGNVRDSHAALQQHIDGGGTLSKRAQDQFNRMGQRIENQDARREAKERAQAHQAAQPAPQPAAPTAPPPQNNQQSGSNVSQDQNISQDNDQTSNVEGDNNYVYQNQDNSIRNYGGDNRSFVYNSNGGEGPDTPATMATLAGYYAPDDSPGATAARLDQHVTMNRDNQKAYANTSHIAQGAIARAEQNSYIDPAALDKRIAARSQYHTDRATIQGANIFGDLYGLEGPDWNSAKPADPVEKPDFEKMHDTYTDF